MPKTRAELEKEQEARNAAPTEQASRPEGSAQLGDTVALVGDKGTGDFTAAVVTQIVDNPTTVLAQPMAGGKAVRAVYDPTKTKPGSWHWPNRN